MKRNKKPSPRNKRLIDALAKEAERLKRREAYMLPFKKGGVNAAV